ncbi:MAG: hypothetical protein WCP32_19910 [Bacteroidota bacterium]
MQPQYPETLLQIQGLKPIKAIADFINLRNSIHQESAILLTRVDIGEFRSVHSGTSMDALIQLSRGEKPEIRPALTMDSFYLYDFLAGTGSPMFYSASTGTRSVMTNRGNRKGCIRK